jgi:UDP-N-acetylmuramyl pentapeptide phosphotransferase/UDP-N-acetylglucosamine-1-phosphate transferase
MVALFALVPWIGDGWLLVPVAVLMAVSFADDRLSLSSGLRFVVQALAVAVFLFLAGVEWVWWTPLLGFALLWMVNLYNFMDGSDGLAGGMAAIGFGAYALAAGGAGVAVVAGWSGVLAGAAVGFLRFNLHPAKVFMGDVGSVPLGFLAGALGVLGWQDGAWPAWFPVVVFGPFIADATVTLLRRIVRGERFWQAHREHFYQRLVLSGFGHAHTAWAAYGLMVFCAGAALAGVYLVPSLAVGLLAAVVLVLVAAGYWVERRWQALQGRQSG